MSLLINGINMPELDENAERLWVPGWIEIGKDGKAIFCTGTHFDPNTIRSYPIEEVPTPHGRLIDADRLIAVLKSTTAISQSDYNLFNHIVGLIEHQPTVIEKEKE